VTYSFLRKPRWIGFTIGILAVMALMLVAARWQWHRYQFKHDRNAEVSLRSKIPGQPVSGLVHPGEPSEIGTTLEWRNVTATGSYLGDKQVLVLNRSFEGLGGSHVITPLRLADGSILLVNRGWVDATQKQAPPAPTGSVTVLGRVRPTQTRGSFGPHDAADGVLTQMARVDVARLSQQLDSPTLPIYVELIRQQPGLGADAPRLIPEPDRDDGPHLSYMVQWIIFTICAAVGWVIVVKRTARQRERDRGRELDSLASEPETVPVS
jgi:surfeit locus 1 family protein